MSFVKLMAIVSNRAVQCAGEPSLETMQLWAALGARGQCRLAGKEEEGCHSSSLSVEIIIGGPRAAVRAAGARPQAKAEADGTPIQTRFRAGPRLLARFLGARHSGPAHRHGSYTQGPGPPVEAPVDPHTRRRRLPG